MTDVPEDSEEGPGTHERGVRIFLVSGLAPHLDIGSHDEVGQLLRDVGGLFLTEGNVSSHQPHIHGVVLARGLAVVLVHVGDVLGQSEIVLTVGLICNQPEQVKSEEKREKSKCGHTSILGGR